MSNKIKTIIRETGARELVFATDNINKLTEIRKLLPPGYIIISMHEAGITGPIPETGATIGANALQKARYAAVRTTLDCFSDDTGLEVEALGGRPGVHSARYAGPRAQAADNILKLLDEMKTEINRKAIFRTVIAAVIGGKEHLFSGEIAGNIAWHVSGNNGFGYDPLFIPDGFDRTFAVMTPDEKNRISHRARAAARFSEFLDARRKAC